MSARKILAVSCSSLVLLFSGLSGCSDDDGGGTSSGVLIDAAVEGINYRCGSSTTTSGTTTATGMYTCPTGQSVSFYVGDILVGSIPTTLAKATPLDMAGAGSTVTDAEVTNITRFLMSISSTDPSTGKITVTSAVHTAATGQTIDFATANSASLATLLGVVAPGNTLVTALEAQAHLTDSLNDLFAGSYSGTFSGDGSGTWQLTINSSGAVSGTYTPAGGGAGPVNGQMAPALTTGGRYVFAGTTDGGTWGGYLDVASGAFNGTWTGGGGSQGIYMGRKQ